MSDRMRLDEAELYAEFRPVKRNMGRAARTIIHQGRQIKRLQNAVRLLASIEAMNNVGVSQQAVIDRMRPHLTAEDMEEQ